MTLEEAKNKLTNKWPDLNPTGYCEAGTKFIFYARSKNEDPNDIPLDPYYAVDRATGKVTTIIPGQFSGTSDFIKKLKPFE